MKDLKKISFYKIIADDFTVNHSCISWLGKFNGRWNKLQERLFFTVIFARLLKFQHAMRSDKGKNPVLVNNCSYTHFFMYIYQWKSVSMIKSVGW